MSRLFKNRRRTVGLLVIVGSLLISLLAVLPRSAEAADQGLTGPPPGTQLCNSGPDSSLLTNPLSVPPAGAVTVPAGDDSTLAMSNGKIIAQNFGIDPGTVYFFVAGTHTLGSSNFGQIDPKAGDVFEGAPGAVLNGEGINQSAFDGTASGVTIEYLTIENFVPGTDAIAVNHDSGPNWTIRDNTIRFNTGAGVGLGTGDVVTENCLGANDQYGFNAVSSSPVSNISITDNEIANNDTNGTYDQNSSVVSYAVASNVATIVTRGPLNLVAGHTILIGAASACGFSWCTNLSDAALNGPRTIASVLGPNAFTFDVTTANVPTTADPTATVADSLVNEGAAGGGKFWDITGGATVTGNWVHGNGYAGLWPDTDNAGFNISGNYIDHNWAEGIIYEASYNGAITGNTFVDNAWGGGPSPALGGFPDAALYLSESGSDPRVPGAYGSAFNVTNNVFTDNWGGVVIYENSNRACGVSNDALCTLVAPGTYTLASCAAHIPGGLTSATPDYVDNCRWKSENITVADNTFNFTAADIGSDCTTANTCGYNGLFSEGGTIPSSIISGLWPLGALYPYAGYTVPNNISNSQNNSFASNAYCGSWNFVGFAQGNSMTPSQWTAGESNAAASGDYLPRAGCRQLVHDRFVHLDDNQHDGCTTTTTTRRLHPRPRRRPPPRRPRDRRPRRRPRRRRGRRQRPRHHPHRPPRPGLPHRPRRRRHDHDPPFSLSTDDHHDHDTSGAWWFAAAGPNSG